MYYDREDEGRRVTLLTCTAEFRKQLFWPGALVRPLLLLNVMLIREHGPWL